LVGERYAIGNAVAQMTRQIGMVAGFALGGVIVVALGSRTALVIDAATFVNSALLLRLWVKRRAVAESSSRENPRSARLANGRESCSATSVFVPLCSSAG